MQRKLSPVMSWIVKKIASPRPIKETIAAMQIKPNYFLSRIAGNLA